MTHDITGPAQLTQFLSELGKRCTEPASLYVFGGSALVLLGGSRHTGDLDFSITAAQPDTLRALIATVAEELNLDVEESIPAEFMPMPTGAEDRHRRIGRYGMLTVYIFDPYSISVMKIDRSFKTDLQDVQFLINAGIVDLNQLEKSIEDVAARYEEPITLRRKFDELRRFLQR